MPVCWRREIHASLLLYNYQMQYELFTAHHRTSSSGKIENPPAMQRCPSD